MHQDQRIGLALGVLLIGACAAFFFRNETPAIPMALRLKHAKELDERIADRSTRPYTRGIEAVERRTFARQERSSPPTDTRLARGSTHSWNEFGSHLFGKSDEAPHSNRPLPDDHTVVVTNDFLASASAIETNVIADEQPTPTIDRSEHPSEPIRIDATPTDQTVERTYVVQKGDSLSSVAAKCLGDRNRFHEIFEANRDQLADVNSVKSGVVLRIPDDRTNVASTMNRDRSQSHGSKTTPKPDQQVATSISLTSVVPPLVELNPTASQVLNGPSESTTTSQAQSVPAPLNPTAEPASTGNPETKRFVPARKSSRTANSRSRVNGHADDRRGS